MTLTCHFCGAEFDRPTSRGRVPRYCRPSHRQRAYEDRKWEQVDDILAANDNKCVWCDTEIRRSNAVFIPDGNEWQTYCHPCNLEMVR